MNSNFLLKSQIYDYTELCETSININNNKSIFEFNENIENISCSPYIYINTFNININYNIFTLNINKLLKHKIEKKEFKYFYNTYGGCMIQKKKNIRSIIKEYLNNNMYSNLVNILIINKRLEFLLEYTVENNFSIEYINYINKISDALYKNTKHIINLLKL